jgi:hypothetical protein
MWNRLTSRSGRTNGTNGTAHTEGVKLTKAHRKALEALEKEVAKVAVKAAKVAVKAAKAAAKAAKNKSGDESTRTTTRRLSHHHSCREEMMMSSDVTKNTFVDRRFQTGLPSKDSRTAPSQLDWGAAFGENSTASAPLWYHGRTSRSDAEKSLAAAPPSSYLVRKADVINGRASLSLAPLSHTYSLSLRVPENTRWSGVTVKHYRILQDQASGWFELKNSILSRPRFPRIQKLVAAFGSCAPSRTDGVLLTFPCQIAENSIGMYTTDIPEQGEAAAPPDFVQIDPAKSKADSQSSASSELRGGERRVGIATFVVKGATTVDECSC